MKYISIIILSVLIFSCPNKNEKTAKKVVLEKKEILIYCENVMVPALMEIKEKFEQEWNCKVKLQNDCSQNLVSLIRYSLEGDIYLPASYEGFKKLRANNHSFIIASVFIGYNPLVVMSLKGNAANYNGDIGSLALKKHAVIIANPETSSLGAETRNLFEKRKLYSDVILNVVALSTDSRGLVKSLKNDEAQLVINWKSDLYNNGNQDIVEFFDIPESNESPSEIYAGILSTSQHSTLAREFLDYATGNDGLLVFRKYGFNRRKSLIF